MQKPYNFIEEVISKIGPRIAGTTAEDKGQDFVVKQLEEFCHTVEKEPFEAALTAKFKSLRWFCWGLYLSLGLYWVDERVAFLLALVNSVLFFGHFLTYKSWLDFLWPKQKSSNVTGTIEPKGEVKQTLIFSGHIDNVREFQVWYHLKQLGAKLTVGSGLLIVLMPIFYFVMWSLSHFIDLGMGAPIAVGVYTALAPITFAFYFIHGKIEVDGAQDNLSGIATGMHALYRLQEKNESLLQHTRLKFISFGAEECGLKGSTAYARKHKEALLAENAHVINLDGILDIEHINVSAREPSALSVHDPALVKKLVDHINASGLKATAGWLPIGATDATPFSWNGIPATSIVCLPLDELHPTYHTRLDTIEHLNADTLDKIVEVLVQFAHKIDQE